MHLSVLLLALASTLPSPVDVASACDRNLAADVYAVLDCEQADTVVPITEEPIASLDAEADDDDSNEARRHVSPTLTGGPAPDAPVFVAPLRLPLPSIRRADAVAELNAPPRHFVVVAIPRARAQLPEPPTAI
jgi:hypothetical protein